MSRGSSADGTSGSKALGEEDGIEDEDDGNHGHDDNDSDFDSNRFRTRLLG
jgi:hypothetical protein